MARTQLLEETTQHTSCLMCGELVFDRKLARCRRCGGPVAYLSDSDMNLMARHRPQPVNTSSDED